jgi:hypothetical protein
MLAILTRRSKKNKEIVGDVPADPAAAAGKAKKAKPRSRRRCLKLSRAEHQSIPALLEPYRYQARSSSEWQTVQHELKITIQVRDHVEVKGRTTYQVQCTLSSEDETVPVMTWGCQRRLQHLRKGLHDVAKQQMGSFYAGCFKGAPFAHRGGILGTTRRLDAWCARLARCINSGAVPPLVVAQTLKLLDAPKFMPGLDSSSTPTSPVFGCVGRTSKDSGLEGADTTDAEVCGEDDAESECESYESDWESDSEFSDDADSVAEDLPSSGDEALADDEVDALHNAGDLQVSDLVRDKEDSLDEFMRLAAQGHCWRK